MNSEIQLLEKQSMQYMAAVSAKEGRNNKAIVRDLAAVIRRIHPSKEFEQKMERMLRDNTEQVVRTDSRKSTLKPLQEYGTYKKKAATVAERAKSQVGQRVQKEVKTQDAETLEDVETSIGGVFKKLGEEMVPDVEVSPEKSVVQESSPGDVIGAKAAESDAPTEDIDWKIKMRLDLDGMGFNELKAYCEEHGIEVPKGAKYHVVKEIIYKKYDL